MYINVHLCKCKQLSLFSVAYMCIVSEMTTDILPLNRRFIPGKELFSLFSEGISCLSKGGALWHSSFHVSWFYWLARDRSRFSLFYMCRIWDSLLPFVGVCLFSSICCWHFRQNWGHCMPEFITRSSLHWSTCPFLCLYHAVLVIMSLDYFLRQELSFIQHCFFFLRLHCIFNVFCVPCESYNYFFLEP